MENEVREQDGFADIELSVVIPAYNAADTIGTQLEALVAQEWSAAWEIVVADNGSTDETRRIVDQFGASHSRIRMIDASGVVGPSHARNRGVAAARGTSIAFCDADDVVSPTWIRAIGDALRTSSFVTGPQEYERLNPEWAWGIYGTVVARELQHFEKIFPFGPSANLGVSRSCFDAVGGFDTSLSTGEDLDLCLRLWLAGVPLVFVPEAVVHYRYRSDLSSIWRQAVSYGAATPEIARRLARAGCPTPSRWNGAKRWIWLLREVPTLRTQAGRARWVVVAGSVAGRIVGSVRSRWLIL